MTNARRLEDLDPGTPVSLGDVRIGEVVAVYAEDDARLPECVVVRWNARGADVMVSANEVQSIGEHGVLLIGTDARAYDRHPIFHPEGHPTFRKLRG